MLAGWLALGGGMAMADAPRLTLRAELPEPMLSEDLWLDAGAGGVTARELQLASEEGRTLQLAQAAAPASSLSVQASNAGVSAGVAQEYSTWADLTAVFRPSRWRLPIRVGEPLSFLNWRAWHDAPGRTAKVFAGVVVVAGVTVAIVSAASSSGGSDGGHRDTSVSQPAPQASPSSSSGGGGTSRPRPTGGGSSSSSGSGSSSSGSSGSDSSGSGSSGSGGSSGDDESPF